MSLITFIVYAIDKNKARKKGARRISEATLLTLSVLGGCYGGYLAMIIKHHKTKHWYFVLTNILGRYEEAYDNCLKAFEYVNSEDNDQLSSLYDQKISLLCSMEKYEEAGKTLTEALHVLSEDNGNYLKSCYNLKRNKRCLQ